MLKDLKIKIFADGADLENIKELCKNSLIKGFTANPSLMKKRGITDYKEFALEVLKVAEEKPVSFEIFADDFESMEKQALEISTWGKNVNVKIPITNTKGEKTNELIKKLSNKKVICNITAIFTLQQIEDVVRNLNPETPAVLSVFAGRIADIGLDPMNIMKEAVNISKSKPKTSILWASTREVLNIFQAEKTGCQIITVPHDIIAKFKGVGKSLDQSSLETVKMFYNDAVSVGYKIETDGE